MTPITDALALANKVLDRPHADPDDDLATMARGVILMHEYATRPPTTDHVKLANAILSIGMVPGIFRGPKRWAWALEKAREVADRMDASGDGQGARTSMKSMDGKS
jgi:hypothetical protein